MLLYCLRNKTKCAGFLFPAPGRLQGGYRNASVTRLSEAVTCSRLLKAYRAAILLPSIQDKVGQSHVPC